jgi:hypothetical protein
MIFVQAEYMNFEKELAANPDFSNILEVFENPDLSIIKKILYFNGWSTYDESEGYLIFIGVDDTIQLCQYDSNVFADDNTNYFTPREISKREYFQCVKNMDYCIANTSDCYTQHANWTG